MCRFFHLFKSMNAEQISFPACSEYKPGSLLGSKRDWRPASSLRFQWLVPEPRGEVLLLVFSYKHIFEVVSWASQVALVVKKKNKLPANAGDVRYMGSSSELGRSPGEGHGTSLEYSCLENPMDRGAWQLQDQQIARNKTFDPVTSG